VSTRQFGEKVQRREDPRLLTGNGRYLDDLGHDALAAAFVRSPHAHARVVDVDIDDAWEVDGVEAIYTWEDLPGRVAEPVTRHQVARDAESDRQQQRHGRAGGRHAELFAGRLAVAVGAVGIAFLLRRGDLSALE